MIDCQFFSLCDTLLDYDCAEEMGHVVEGNQTLTSLDLSENPFGDVGILCLSAGLRGNSALTHLR